MAGDELPGPTTTRLTDLAREVKADLRNTVALGPLADNIQALADAVLERFSSPPTSSLVDPRWLVLARAIDADDYERFGFVMIDDAALELAKECLSHAPVPLVEDEVEHWRKLLAGDYAPSGFTEHLMKLMYVSDATNLRKLSLAFPEAVHAFCEFSGRTV